MKLHEKLPVHEEKWLAALRRSKNKDLIFTLGSLSSFREENLQMTLIAKASPALLGRCPWRNELPLSRHLLNFLFYIGVNKAYVLLVLLIIFWDSSCKLGTKEEEREHWDLLPNHPKWNSGCEMLMLSLQWGRYNLLFMGNSIKMCISAVAWNI